MRKKQENTRNFWRMQFIISVLGTSIGVGLTFGIGRMIENQKKEQAQRVTTSTSR